MRIFLLLLILSTFSYSETYLKLNHLFDNEKLEKTSTYDFGVGGNFKIERLEYFISLIEITDIDGKIFSFPDLYILVDAFENDTYEIPNYQGNGVKSISFGIGVDIARNNSDPNLYNPGHPLAPRSPSMHWGWAAGYRFLAVEGRVGLGLFPFQIHALGNQNYFISSYTVTTQELNGNSYIMLNADYKRIFDDFEVYDGLNNHGDKNEAVISLENFRDYVFSPETVQTLQNTESQSINVDYFQDKVIVESSNNIIYKIDIYDMAGSIHQIVEVNSGIKEFTINNSGIYFMKIETENGIFTEKVLISK